MLVRPARDYQFGIDLIQLRPQSLVGVAGYEDAASILAHLENVGPLLEEALTMADLTRLEVHGHEAEVDQLRGPLKDLSPQFFTLEYGFRR